MKFHVDPEKATQLNLRRAPNPGEIIAVLPQGTNVEKQAEHGTQPHWWEVIAELGGQSVRGFVNSEYLKSGPGPVVPPVTAGGIPSCHLRRNGAGRKHDFGRANPLDDSSMPLRGSGTPAQKRDNLVGISKYLDPGKTSHTRYLAGGGKTYCNIYAYDFCTLGETFAPRIWWTDAALVAIRGGNVPEVLYASTVREMTANMLYDWFEDFGGTFGWRRVFEATELQDGANAGEVGIIVAKRVNLARSGHIVAVLPEHDGIQAARDGSRVTRPVQSQAGAENFRAKATPTRWWIGSQFQSHGFWLHA